MKFSFSDVFRFERFFTPILIKAIYLIYIIGGVLYLIFQTLSSAAMYAEYGVEFSEYIDYVALGMAGTAMAYIGGLLLLRLLLEAMIVIFNIYNNLHAMKESLAAEDSHSTASPVS